MAKANYLVQVACASAKQSYLREKLNLNPVISDCNRYLDRLEGDVTAPSDQSPSRSLADSIRPRSAFEE